jgi:hypothetical protein
MRTIIAFLFCICSLPLHSGAEEKTCRIIFPDRPQNAPQEVYLFDGEVSHKIALPSMNFSEILKLPAGDLELSITADAVSESAAITKAAPQVKIPAGMKNFYLVVLSDPGNTTMPLRMLPLDSGDDHLRPGQTLWVNLTAHRIACDYGDCSLDIPPDTNVVGEPPLKDSGYFKVKFRYQPNASGDFLPVMQKSAWFDAQSKNLGFILNSNNRFPRIFTIRDYREPKNP